MTACLLWDPIVPIGSKAQVSIQPIYPITAQSSPLMAYYPPTIHLIDTQCRTSPHREKPAAKPPLTYTEGPTHQPTHLRNQSHTKKSPPIEAVVAGLRKVEIICRTSRTPTPNAIL